MAMQANHITQEDAGPSAAADVNHADALREKIGHQRINELFGLRSRGAISNHIARGRFPASWWDVMEQECRARGIDCPKEAFAFVRPDTAPEGDDGE